MPLDSAPTAWRLRSIVPRHTADSTGTLCHMLFACNWKHRISDRPTAVAAPDSSGDRNIHPSPQLRKLPDLVVMQRTRGGAGVMKGRGIAGGGRCSAHGAGGLHHSR